MWKSYTRLVLNKAQSIEQNIEVRHVGAFKTHTHKKKVERLNEENTIFFSICGNR